MRSSIKYKVTIGESYGYLKILEEVRTQRKSGKTLRGVRCACKCGNVITRQLELVVLGKIKSCGCIYRWESAKSKSHGLTGTNIYNRWRSMKQRCYDPNADMYGIYGGRGIKVCDAWQEFVPFYEWAIANGYSKNLQLDRIDNNGNYGPENCRWVTASENSNNRRTSHFVEYNGERDTIIQMIRKLGLLHHRGGVDVLMRRKKYTFTNAVKYFLEKDKNSQ